MNSILDIIPNIRLLYIEHHKLSENAYVLEQDLSSFIGLKPESLTTYKSRGSIPYPTILEFCQKYAFDPLKIFFEKNSRLCTVCEDEITNENQSLNGGYIRGQCKSCFAIQHKERVLKSRAKKLASLTHCSKKDCGVLLDDTNTVFITRKNKDCVPITKKSTVCKTCTNKKYENKILNNLKTSLVCEDCGKTKTEKSFTLNTTDMIVCNTCFKYKAAYSDNPPVKKEKVIKVKKPAKKKKVIPVKKKVKKPIVKKVIKKVKKDLPAKKSTLPEIEAEYYPKREETLSFIRKNTKEEEDMIAKFLANKK